MKKSIKKWETKAGFKAFVCLISRDVTDDRHYCGYVGIDKTHPLYDKPYGDHCNCLSKMLKEVLDGPIGKRGIMSIMFRAANSETASMDIVFDVHGGVTFSDFMDENKDIYWIGFDCDHVGDNVETQDLDYCINECENLATQLKKVLEGDE